MSPRADPERYAAVRDAGAAIGARVRHIRMLRRRSQEWLGRQLGMTFQQVQKYESGANRVAACTLIAIAGALDADLLDFYPPTPARPIGAIDLAVVRDEAAAAVAACDAAIETIAATRERLLDAAARLAGRETAPDADDASPLERAA